MSNQLERLNATQEKMIDELCEQLAESEECPYYTDEGCPRDEADRRSAWENGRCDKHDRRSRYGKECWRLWAVKKTM